VKLPAIRQDRLAIYLMGVIAVFFSIDYGHEAYNRVGGDVTGVVLLTALGLFVPMLVYLLVIATQKQSYRLEVYLTGIIISYATAGYMVVFDFLTAKSKLWALLYLLGIPAILTTGYLATRVFDIKNKQEGNL